jgi:hypothetical protein
MFMAIKHATLTIGTTPVQLDMPEPSGASQSQSMLISAEGDVFVGGEGVTTSDYGYKISVGAPLAADMDKNDTLYAVADVDTIVTILYMGV